MALTLISKELTPQYALRESFDCVRCGETATVLSTAELAVFESAVVASDLFVFPNPIVFVRARCLSVLALGR